MTLNDPNSGVYTAFSTVSDNSNTQRKSVIDEEITDVYKPKTSRLYGTVVDDDEENSTGVNVNFD